MNNMNYVWRYCQDGIDSPNRIREPAAHAFRAKNIMFARRSSKCIYDYVRPKSCVLYIAAFPGDWKHGHL